MAPPKSIPQNFNAVQTTIPTYDYYDLDEGTGTVTYYGLLTSRNPSTFVPDDFIISRNFMVGVTSHNENYENPMVFELSPFNFSKTIKGTGYVEIHISDATATGTLSAEFNHYDGTTETQIGSKSLTGVQNGDFILKIDLTQKHFKRGDILRVKISVGQNNGTTSFTAANPLKIYVPYRIDI